jgi:hypothetical protein
LHYVSGGAGDGDDASTVRAPPYSRLAQGPVALNLQHCVKVSFCTPRNVAAGELCTKILRVERRR